MHCLIIFLIVFHSIGPTLIGSACYGQTSPLVSTTQPIVIRPSVAWASVPWIGNNLPFHQVRAAIDLAYAQHKVTAAHLNEYHSDYLKSKQPALAFFKWAYAAYVGTKQTPPIIQQEGIGSARYNEPPDPHCYDYTRLRFLIEAPTLDRNLIPLGRKLVRKNPRDFDVTYALIKFYSPEEGVLTKQEAVSDAQHLLALYPNRVQSYAAEGGIYYVDWLEKKSPTTGKHSVADGAKAVYLYQKYIQLAPANDPFRAQAELLIHDIQHPTF